MKIIKNLVLKGRHNKPVITDLFYAENGIPKSIVIFAHGYKGYKDWGCWNLVAELFSKHDLFFVKFNFSHNGGTTEQPIDFPDLEAFGNNNYCKELDDLGTVIDWLHTEGSVQAEIDLTNIVLIGHSRGGGIVTLKANEDSRISKLISWAGVSDYETRFPKGDLFSKWKEEGVYYITNGRTKQQMPHYFQFLQNFKRNQERLDIKKACKNLKIPHLIIHGTHDEAVPVEEAQRLHAWNSNSELHLIENGKHTFDSKQPWGQTFLPSDLQKVVDKTILFVP